MRDLNTKYKLYFHHEFIDDRKFPERKKALLKSEGGSYYIPDDFTIYQQKRHPKSLINHDDFITNRSTFIRMLYYLPIDKSEAFIKFHFKKYPGTKKSFTDYALNELKSSNLKQGDKVLEFPQKNIIVEWLENKRNRKSKFWLLRSENLRWTIGIMLTIIIAIVTIYFRINK